MNEIEELKSRIQNIEDRNARVEANKKWETSWTRRVSVAMLTYVVICIFLVAVHTSNIFLTALVPVLGFILSTISLRIIRKMKQSSRLEKKI